MRVGYIVQPALQYGGWNVLIISVQEGDGLHIRTKLTITAYRGKLTVAAYHGKLSVTAHRGKLTITAHGYL
jgi:uncharacterized protein (DUF2345 family)